MIIALENTDKIVTLVVNGHEVPARIWQGHTDGGVPIHAYITRVAVQEGLEHHAYETFEAELLEVAKMRPDVAGIPVRLIV